MKKYNIIISLLLTLLLSLSFTSCNNSNSSENNSTNNSTTKPLSPIEQLNTKEKVIYDAFLINLENWNNPTEVKIVECGSELLEDWEDNNVTLAHLKIKCFNALGTSLIKRYILIVKSNKQSTNRSFGHLIDCDEGMTNDNYTGWSNVIVDESKISAKKIQAAIDQYWRDKGLK